MGRWNGDNWRWHKRCHPEVTQRTIAVIEVPEEERKKPAPGAKRVPFGFGRALAEGTKDPNPLGEVSPWGNSRQRRSLQRAIAKGDVPLC